MDNEYLLYVKYGGTHRLRLLSIFPSKDFVQAAARSAELLHHQTMVVRISKDFVFTRDYHVCRMALDDLDKFMVQYSQ